MAEMDFITQAAARRRGVPRLPGSKVPRRRRVPGMELEDDGAVPARAGVELDEAALAAADEGALVEQAARRRRAGVIGGALEAAAAGLTADVGEIPDTRGGAVLGGLMKGIVGVGATAGARRRAGEAAAGKQAEREGRLAEKIELMRLRAGMKEDPAEQARRVAEATLPIKERLARIQSGEQIERFKATRELARAMSTKERADVYKAALEQARKDMPFVRPGDRHLLDERADELFWTMMGNKLNLGGLR